MSGSIAPPMSGSTFLLANLDYPKQKVVSPTYVADIFDKAILSMDRIIFTHSIIDKPQEGQLYLISLPPTTEVSSDGYHYLDAEITLKSNLPDGRELLCSERKQGFAPGDPITSKVRRRYRFATGHSDLQLLHYSSLDENQRQRVNPAYMAPRRYPIPPMPASIGPYARPLTGMSQIPSPMHKPVQSSPAQRGPIATAPTIPMVNPYVQFQARAGGGINQRMNPQGHLTHTPAKSNRRAKGAKNKSAMAAAAAVAVEETDEPSGDELDNLKLREVSMSRFKRNHEYLSEIFSAYSISNIIPPESPYQSLNVEELKQRLADGEAEIEKMKSENAEKMRKFSIESNILSKSIQEIKKCTSLEELTKIQERTEKELGIVIEPYNPVTIVKMRDTPDSEAEDDDEQRGMMQDNGVDEEIDGELEMDVPLLDAVHEEELVGIGQGLSTYNIEESLVTGNEIDGTSGIVEGELQGYLNPVEVV
ncbi:10235_t:CDS:10, partial [Acaulospora morrowiae]